MGHKEKEHKPNCWEFKKCGREKGGANAVDLGVCPASIETALHGVHDGTNSGRACWVLDGTLCAASVQGSFLEKFKKCITCDFFHLIEAQEGRDLKNAKDLLRIIEAETVQEVSEKIKAKAHPVAVCQGCGQELCISISPNWRVNIVGLLEFECCHCKRVIHTKGLLAEDPRATIELSVI
ncbi:MAG: hypothetical protein PHI06_03635 [Desulfobulbaceae bacterium]|nr:hypothetical protein [Desulfobulbaceae bacterium]